VLTGSRNDVSPWPWAVGGVLVFAVLATERGAFAGWLRQQRAEGAHTRPLVIVGNNGECIALADLIESQPELGYRLVGYLGPPDVPADERLPWLGGASDVPGTLERLGVDSVLIAASALPSRELTNLTRDLLERGVHVHLASGLAGFAQQRLRPLPLGFEPVFYVERHRPTRLQLAMKRTLDVILATFALIVLSPVLLLSALAIKLTDRGPVIYRQKRVGRDGVLFTCLKFRTMRCNAEQQLEMLRAHNVRNGPLFKVSDDPRVTPVGRFLRASSIDELPQLFNVLNGTMSLVGPRPALPEEHDVFDLELQGRVAVRPGITGLWQVEARDNPAFSPYRRLDLYYIENWSVGLDLTVLLRTLPVVISRALQRSDGPRTDVTTIRHAAPPAGAVVESPSAGT
jgi:exopolysaccharide biosynthesis polyprenyl glycosylphosphotransferase